MKTCRICKRADPHCGFHASKTTRDKLRTECKDCRRKMELERYHEGKKDKRSAYHRAYRKDNQDRITAYQKKYRESKKST